MKNSENYFQIFSKILEGTALSSQDFKKEFEARLMAAKDIFVNKMNLVSKDDYQILKKIVEKQNLEIKKLKQRLKRKK
jgi:BMFP domain-containing protein YqiC